MSQGTPSTPPPPEPAPAAVGRPRRRLTAREVRARRRRVITWILSVALGILLVNSVVGENGYLSTIRITREEGQLRAGVARLRLENARLQQESRSLEHDPTAVEDAARRELGMIRPGETVIILKDAPAAGATPAPSEH